MAKGGGAWKVAYADFVTAMMAFFLVMWIVVQDQKIKKAVANYFQDPYGEAAASSKKPSRTGALTELQDAGNLPESESVARGQGRKSYTVEEQGSATKLVGDWIASDQEAHQYWLDQAQQQRKSAEHLKHAGGLREPVDRVAVRQLSKQLQDEFKQTIPPQVKDLYKDLLCSALAEVNWTEIAEDLLTRN